MNHKTSCPSQWVDVVQARIRELESALRKIIDADRGYPDNRIANDMQYCAREALGLIELEARTK